MSQVEGQAGAGHTEASRSVQAMKACRKMAGEARGEGVG